MRKYDLEITIDPTGQVKLHIEGIKGKACMDIARAFEEIIGEITAVEHTSEYYEQEVGIEVEGHLGVGK